MQASFTSGQLSKKLQARVDFAGYQTGLKLARNVIIHAEGGVSNRPGTHYIASVDYNDDVRMIPFRFSENDTYMLVFGDNKFHVFRNGAQVVYSSGGSAGLPVEVTTPWDESGDVPNLRYEQSNDVLYVFNGGVHSTSDNFIYRISRTDHDAWSVDEVQILTPFPTVSGPTITGITSGAFTVNDRTRRYRVTYFDEDNRESEPGAVSTSVTVDTNWPAAAKVTVTWGAVTGATGYNVYAELDASGEFGYIGSTTSGLSFVDDNIIPDYTQGANRTFYQQTGARSFGKPSAGGLHNQRLVVGGALDFPNRIAASNLGEFEYFEYHSPRRADDAFVIDLDSGERNVVRHILSTQSGILVMTSAAEILVSDGGLGFSVENLQTLPQSRIGSTKQKPLKIDNQLLIIAQKTRYVYSLAYNNDANGYLPMELSILSRDLLKSGNIRDWCYQSKPDSIVWAVTFDGRLLSCTYVPEHKVVAWSWHDTDGDFEAVGCVEELGDDAVYVAVRRNLNGTNVQTIERFTDRDFDTLADAFFVDCGLTYSGSAVTTITGLTHLEGEAVSVLADGLVVEGLTVSGGEITLPRSASKVHVGLPFTSQVQTLEETTGYFKKKSTSKVGMVLEESRGLKVGPNANRLNEIRDRDADAYADPTGLYDGKIEMTLEGSWSDRGQVFCEQTKPLPFTILSIAPVTDATR